MRASEKQHDFSDIDGLLDWAYLRLAQSPRPGVVSSYEPGIRSTDPTEPSGLELCGEGCGVRGLVGNLKPMDRFTIEAEYIYPWDDVLGARKEHAIHQLCGYFYQLTRNPAPHKFALDRFRHHASARNARLSGYPHHALHWWAKHLGMTRSRLRHMDADSRQSIRNFFESARVIAHSRIDALCRDTGWLK